MNILVNWSIMQPERLSALLSVNIHGSYVYLFTVLCENFQETCQWTTICCEQLECNSCNCFSYS